MSEALAIYSTQHTAYPMPYVLPAQQRAFSADLFALFIDYCSVKDTTLKGYINNVKAFARWMQENGITQPTRADIKAYVEYLASCGKYKTSTQAAYLRAVKQFFKFTATLDEQHYYPNIAENIKGAKIRNTTHKRDAVPADAIPVLASGIDTSTEKGKRLCAILLLCSECGTRTVELSRANIEDVKTIGGKHYIYLQGKGHDEKDQIKGISQGAKDAIDSYLAARTDRPTGKSPLFASTSNRSKGQRIAPTAISTMLKGLLKSGGYDSDRLTAHSFRHASITAAWNITNNLYLAQQHARHADPATTEIYMHTEEMLNSNIEQRIHDYFFNKDAAISPLQEACQLLQDLPADKLEKALAMLKML